MKKRMALAIIVLLVIFGGTFAFDAVRSYFMKQYFAKFKPPPVSVSTTKAVLQTWHPTLQSVGTLMAVNGVNVSSEVAGQVVKIYFKSGEFVKEGQPLVQLDTSIDEQTLKNDLAVLRLDELNFNRQLKLYKGNVSAKSTLDSAQAKLTQSQASVATARVQISKKQIKAPFSGKVGIRLINLGQYIQPGDAMVALQALDPLFVDFSLPEQNLKDISVGQPIKIQLEGYPNQAFSGKIAAVNSKVDQNTRTFLVRAIVPNKENKLYPGVFADVTIILPVQKNVITVPQTAVTYSLYGDSIYVLQPADKSGKQQQQQWIAKQAFVKTGERYGNVVQIKSGIKEGDVVVTSGQLKLFNGIHVVINNTVKIQ